MNLTKTDEPTNVWYPVVVMLGLFIAHFIVQHRLVPRGVGLGTDPCDAVNLFAFSAIALIAILSLLRMFVGSSSPLRYLYVIRAQQAVLFAIFMMFMAEIVALARSRAMWNWIVSPIRLFALLGALAAVTVATQLVIFVTQRDKLSLSSLRWTHTALPVVVSIVVLTICPEWPIYSSSITAHILTVAVGALVVFIPLRLFLPEIVLNGSDVDRESTTFGTRREWTLLLVGVAVQLFDFWPAWPAARKAIGPIGHMHFAGFLIAYALLGAPLGVAGRLKNSIRNAHADK
jgi:hypothetical protein